MITTMTFILGPPAELEPHPEAPRKADPAAPAPVILRKSLRVRVLFFSLPLYWQPKGGKRKASARCITDEPSDGSEGKSSSKWPIICEILPKKSAKYIYR